MVWDDMRRKVKKQFSDLLEIPGDVLLDLPRIVLMGNLQVQIENHRGIQEYTPRLVRISIGKGMLELTGEDLVLRTIMTDEILVEGKIQSLSFVNLD